MEDTRLKVPSVGICEPPQTSESCSALLEGSANTSSSSSSVGKAFLNPFPFHYYSFADFYNFYVVQIEKVKRLLSRKHIYLRI